MRRPLLPALLVLLCLTARPLHAAELKQRTVEAFERYVRVTEARMAEELRDGNAFLWLDRLAEPHRQSHYAELQQGQIYIESLETREDGQPIKVPDGMVHHWVGVIFIPGVTLQQALALIQDYDNHQNIYKPEVRRSKLLGRDGDSFHIYLQFYRKTIRTVVLNSEFDVRYFPLDAARVHSQGHSARIAEVEDFDQPDEHELPVGKDHGYLWRLNTYWRFQEKDGGVYVQLETIGLTRRIPAFIAWLINPLVKRIPRESLSSLLSSTRTALTSANAAERASP